MRLVRATESYWAGDRLVPMGTVLVADHPDVVGLYCTDAGDAADYGITEQKETVR